MAAEKTLRNRLLLLSLLILFLFVTLNGIIVLINGSMLSRFMNRHLGNHLTEKAVTINLQLLDGLAAGHDLLDLHASDLNLVIAIKRHRPDLLEELFATWRKNALFQTFLLADSDGTVRPATPSFSVAGKQWFREVRERGVSSVCPVDSPDGPEVIWLGSPVRVHGTSYYLLAAIDWSSLTSFLDRSRMFSGQDENSFPLIVGRDRRPLFLPPFLRQRESGSRQDLLRAVNAALAAMPAGRAEGYFPHLPLLDRTYRVAWARSPDHDWTVLFLQDRAVDRALTTAVSRRNLLVSTVILLLGMGMLLFSLARLTTPFRQLLLVTEQILQGRYPDQIGIEAEEEIMQVIRAMNRMIRDVREREEELGKLYEQEKEASLALARANDLLAEQSSELRYKNEELRHAFEELQSVHEELLEAERLAVVGETSGRVAHEVLNPVTAVMFRVEKDLSTWPELEDVVRGMEEIIADWQRELDRGTLCDYLAAGTEEGAPCGEEDLSLLRAMAEEFRRIAEQRQENLRFVFVQIQRVIRIVNNLRESAVPSRSITRFPISRPVEEAVDLLFDSLRKQDIRTSISIAPPVPFVEGDLTELTQVFTNLLRNAMHGIGQKGDGGGRIRVEGRLNGDRVEIRVMDNGAGVAPEIRESIFTPHFTTREKSRGSGLGLAISRRFVREHGGELLLETGGQGVGATFLVILPVAERGA